MIELGWDQVLAFRLARHGLDHRRPLTGAETARRINGVQAQVMSAAELSIGARSSTARPLSVRDELWTSRRLVKTWAMRGTLHLVDASELPLLMAAIRRRSPSRDRTWSRYFGLPEGGPSQLVEAVAAELDGRCLTRRELAEGVVRRLAWMSMDQMLSGWGTFLGLPARHGVLCFGPSLGTNVRFVRPDQWLGSWSEVDEAEAERELLRRYLRLNGPAVRMDYQRWLGGTPARPAWQALQAEMSEVSVEGSRGWLLSEDLAAVRRARFRDEVRLLPHFDHYLLTHHASREHLVAREHHAKIYRTAGWVSPTLLIRGRIAGTWSLDAGTVAVTPLRPLSSAEQRGLASEVAVLGHALGAALTLA